MPTPSPTAPSAAPSDRAEAILAPATPPGPAAAAAITPAQQSGRIKPLSEARFKITFTAPASLVAKLDAVKALLSHAVPGGETAVVVERALEVLHTTLLKRRAGAAVVAPAVHQAEDGEVLSPGAAPRDEPAVEADRSRHIPAAVRAEVWRRDEGRCTFAGPGGRCGESRFIEFHHARPFCLGGRHTAGEITLHCRTHNLLAARRDLGETVMARHTLAGSDGRPSAAHRPPTSRSGAHDGQ